jgi:hypothetical protein
MCFSRASLPRKRRPSSDLTRTYHIGKETVLRLLPQTVQPSVNVGLAHPTGRCAGTVHHNQARAPDRAARPAERPANCADYWLPALGQLADAALLLIEDATSPGLFGLDRYRTRLAPLLSADRSLSNPRWALRSRVDRLAVTMQRLGLPGPQSLTAGRAKPTGRGKLPFKPSGMRYGRVLV